eukprot:GDKH01029140.1.p4 GENE.GDKH01029140.1~~GDKH01029140.1.p4  ORF type:complete len:51 (+),score=2.64 GDKH01029140.1:176-328(+)
MNTQVVVCQLSCMGAKGIEEQLKEKPHTNKRKTMGPDTNSTRGHTGKRQR